MIWVHRFVFLLALKNIKLTTVEDTDIFKDLLIAKRFDWLK